MKIRIRLFAVARQLAGQDFVTLDLPAGATIAQLRAQLAEQVPALAAVLPHVLFAVGSEYVHDHDLVSAEGEVACIPPVSGG